MLRHSLMRLSVKAALAQAYHLKKRGQYAAARSVVQQYLQKYPYDPALLDLQDTLDALLTCGEVSD